MELVIAVAAGQTENPEAPSVRFLVDTLPAAVNQETQDRITAALGTDVEFVEENGFSLINAGRTVDGRLIVDDVDDTDADNYDRSYNRRNYPVLLQIGDCNWDTYARADRSHTAAIPKRTEPSCKASHYGPPEHFRAGVIEGWIGRDSILTAAGAELAGRDHIGPR